MSHINSQNVENIKFISYFKSVIVCVTYLDSISKRYQFGTDVIRSTVCSTKSS